MFYFSPTPSFVCVFSHVAIPKALVVYFQYVVLLGQDEIVHPWAPRASSLPIERHARLATPSHAFVLSLVTPLARS